eukprot:1196086-Prorocentrum_minimum.AAC.4
MACQERTYWCLGARVIIIYAARKPVQASVVQVGNTDFTVDKLIQNLDEQVPVCVGRDGDVRAVAAAPDGGGGSVSADERYLDQHDSTVQAVNR